MGLNPLFARWMYSDGLTPQAALVYKSVVPALCYLPFLVAVWRHPRLALITILLGVFNGAGSMAYLYALAHLPVATTALVYFTYPLFTIVLGFLLFGVPLARRAVITGGLIVIACMLILSPERLTGDQMQILLITFLAPIGFATLILGFDHWLRALSLWERISLAMWGQVLVVTPILLFSPNVDLIPATLLGWTGVFGLALISSLLPQVALTAGVQLIGAVRTSQLGTSELVTALIVGWVIFAEPIFWREVIGAGLLLIALLGSQAQFGKVWRRYRAAGVK